MADFDPYHKWLGIPPRDQPPHHYRLLGVELFESDPDVIAAAAERHVTYLQNVAAGAYVEESQRLLAEVQTARTCLLGAESRAAYDGELRGRLERPAEPKPAEPEAIHSVIAVAEETPSPLNFLTATPSKPAATEKPTTTEKPAATNGSKPSPAPAEKSPAAANAAAKRPADANAKRPAAKSAAKGKGIDKKILMRWGIIAVAVMLLAFVAGILTSPSGDKKKSGKGKTGTQKTSPASSTKKPPAKR